MALSLDKVNKKTKARKQATSPTKKKTPKTDQASKPKNKPAKRQDTSLALQKRKTHSTASSHNSTKPLSATTSTLTANAATKPAPMGATAMPTDEASVINSPQSSSRPQVRPWSQRGLAREGRSPKERVGTNHHMNDEWIDLHEAPLFWLDPSGESDLAKIHEKIQNHLVEFEQFAARIAAAPRELACKAKTKMQALIPAVLKNPFGFLLRRSKV